MKIFGGYQHDIKERLKVSPFIHPTNSCYGIGWNIYSLEVYKRIYEIKWREKNKPFFITVPSIESIHGIAIFDDRIYSFLNNYPEKIFTFILLRGEKLPPYINPYIDTVGIQIATGTLQKLFDFIDFPVFWTSANISHQPVIYDFEDVYTTFSSYKDIVFFEGGNLEKKSPSIIIDLTWKNYKILRWELD